MNRHAGTHAAGRVTGHPCTRAAVGLLALALLACLLAPPALADPLDGVVSGQITNRTAGAATPGGLTVTLVSFGRREQAPLGQWTTQADASGRYTFQAVDRDPNLVYLVVARYQDVSYPAESPFQLTDAQTRQADIPVYESTTTDDAIQVERLNLLVVGVEPGVLQMMEMGSLANTGDRTFVTANPQDQALAHALKLALPSGAMGVQMQAGFGDRDVIPALGGVQVTSPVLPGSHQFALSFQVPYQGASADLSIQVPYATGALSVYLPEGSLRLGGGLLAPAPAAQFGGQSYALYSAAGLPRATMVPATLTGLGVGGTGLTTTQLAMMSLGLVLCLLAGGVLLFGLRRPSARPGVAAAADPSALEQERLALLVRLATLDDRFAAGSVDRATYEAERERGKRRLVALTLARRDRADQGTAEPGGATTGASAAERAAGAPPSRESGGASTSDAPPPVAAPSS